MRKNPNSPSFRENGSPEGIDKSGFRRPPRTRSGVGQNDGKEHFQNFYETIKVISGLNLFIMTGRLRKEKIAAFFSGLYLAGSDRLSIKGGRTYD